jgi:hypothetical protein
MATAPGVPGYPAQPGDYEDMRPPDIKHRPPSRKIRFSKGRVPTKPLVDETVSVPEGSAVREEPMEPAEQKPAQQWTQLRKLLSEFGISSRQPVAKVQLDALGLPYGGATFVFFSDGQIGVSTTNEVEEQLLEDTVHLTEAVDNVGEVILLSPNEKQRLAQAASQATETGST